VLEEFARYDLLTNEYQRQLLSAGPTECGG
jgi:hypothetical protein